MRNAPSVGETPFGRCSSIHESKAMKYFTLLVVASALAIAGSGSQASSQTQTRAVVPAQREAAAASPGLAAEVVVKFKDENLARPIVDMFWKDPVGARTAFDLFKKTRSALSSATLSRVTYSDELVLIYPCAGSAAECAHSALLHVAALKAAPEVAYAETDVMAKAQQPRR
jgi:hypothetical protein